MSTFAFARSASALARVGVSKQTAAPTARRFTSAALLESSPLVGARYGRPAAVSASAKMSAPLAAASYSESAKGRGGAHMTTSASLPAAEHAEGSSSRARRPVGPFRAGMVGFLTGSVIAGVVTYYYILKEYRVSNDLLMTDIYNLQKAINRTEAYVHALEGRADPSKKTRLGD